MSERLKPKKDASASFFVARQRPLPAAKAFNVQSLGPTTLVMPAGTERACSSACVWLEVGMGRG